MKKPLQRESVYLVVETCEYFCLIRVWFRHKIAKNWIPSLQSLQLFSSELSVKSVNLTHWVIEFSEDYIDFKPTFSLYADSFKATFLWELAYLVVLLNTLQSWTSHFAPLQSFSKGLFWWFVASWAETLVWKTLYKHCLMSCQTT